jgi:GNAT superfamily N-acetyltransferase
MTARRSVGTSGTRLAAMIGEERVGFVDVECRDESPRTRGTRTWADIGNLYVEPGRRRLGVGTWLLGQVADWLDLGEVTRLLAYTSARETDAAEAAFYATRGFEVLTRTVRGYTRPTPVVGPAGGS